MRMIVNRYVERIVKDLLGLRERNSVLLFVVLRLGIVPFESVSDHRIRGYLGVPFVVPFLRTQQTWLHWRPSVRVKFIYNPAAGRGRASRHHAEAERHLRA